MNDLLQEFKKFLLRGNLIDLAIAFIIGVAFKAVVDAFTNGLVLPIIAAIGGKPNFDAYKFTINKAEFLYGTFITQVLNFVIVGAACFVIYKAYETMQKRRQTGEVVDETPPEADIVLLSEIRDLLAGSVITKK